MVAEARPGRRARRARALVYPARVPTFADHALFVVLAALFPLRASTFGIRRLKLAPEDERPRVRRSVYRHAIALQWALSLATAALWNASHRDWVQLGLTPRLTGGLIGVAAGFAIVVAVVVRQRRAALASDESLGRLRRRMAALEVMLPHSREELSLFFWLSATAGVCEELLYRGFMIWYLAHWIGLFQAAGVAALVFGVGHLYQGWRGILTTGAAGAFLGAVYILSGSLYAGMVLHALMDAHSGHLLSAAYERERAAKAAAPEPAPAESPA